MKKILQVSAIDVTIEALLKPLIEALMSEKYIVHNACTDTGRFNELQKQGLHMIDIPIERKISPISNLVTIIKLYLLMKKEKYDVVHVHTPIAAILGRIAAKLAGVKHIIYTAHGFYFHEGMSKIKYKFYYLLEKFFAKYFTDWLLVQSREDYDLCVNNNFKQRNRIIHISNGVDIHQLFNPDNINESRKKELKKELGIEENDIVVSFIGRLVKEKGIFELLEAYTTLKEKINNVKLLLIGDILKSERDQESYKILTSKLNNSGIITTGFKKNISDLISISDIFVLPSYREGLPRSVIEAMAMKKPVVASNIRGCREEVIHGFNGFLVEKKDSNALYEKLFILIQDKNMRELFGENSRKIVEEQFDEQKVIAKQIKLFNKLVE